MYILKIDDYSLHLQEEHDTLDEALDAFDAMSWELPSATLVVLDSEGTVIKQS